MFKKLRLNISWLIILLIPTSINCMGKDTDEKFKTNEPILWHTDIYLNNIREKAEPEIDDELDEAECPKFVFVPDNIIQEMLQRKQYFIYTDHLELINQLAEGYRTIHYNYMKSAISWLIKNYPYSGQTILKELQDYQIALDNGDAVIEGMPD